MSDIFKSMKAKKKRVMDPNIIRPNLFSHEKKLKDITAGHEQAMNHVIDLEERVRGLERKLRHQTDYLNMLHSRLLSQKH